MHRLFLSLATCLGLAACAAAPSIVPQRGTTAIPHTDSVTADTPVNVSPAQAARLLSPQMDGQMAMRSLLSVVETVEPVAEALCREQAPDLNCDFVFAIDQNPDAQPNAFQTIDKEGRPLIAFTATLLTEARNSDELAFILSHEAAHHIAGHLARQRRNASIGAAIMGQVAGLSGDADVGRKAAEFGAAIGARTYSKEFELEADALGTEIAARAGFDPLRGADFFFRIPDPGDTFLGTHPANAERLRIVQRTAAQLGLT